MATDSLAKIVEKYGRDAGAPLSGSAAALPPQVADFLNTHGGASFGEGLYRTVRPADFETWQSRIEYAFAGYGKRVLPFGYTWLGDLFGLDSQTSFQTILLFEIGRGEALKIPADLATFHQTTAIEMADAALTADFHKKWRRAGGAAPGLDQCIGYKRPLMLGGKDDETNLELRDLDVYWSLMSQILRKVAGLPEGTRANFSIDDG